MDKESYKNKIKAIDKEAEKKKKKIHIDYANSNNIYKKGDIIQDHYQIIIIEEITYSMATFDECICNYKGEALTKKLVPFKNSKIEMMYGGNVKRKIEK